MDARFDWKICKQMVSGRRTRRDPKRVKKPFKSDFRQRVIFKSKALILTHPVSEKEEIQFWHNLSPVSRQGFVQPFQHACRINFLQYIDSIWSPSPHTYIYSYFSLLQSSLSILLLFLLAFFFFHSGKLCLFFLLLRQQESLLSSQPGVGT